MLGHVADGYLKSKYFTDSKYLLYSIYNITYAFHMPLFMMISGFVYYTAYFNQNGQPQRKRIYRQALNLAGIYLIFSFGFGVFKVACGNFSNSDVSMTDILMIWAKPINPYWYLYTLIGLYMIFSSSITESINTRAILSITICLALISSFIHFEYFQLTSIMYYGFFFFFGMAKRRTCSNIKLPYIILFVNSVLLIAIFWTKAFNEERFFNRIPILGFLIAIGLVLGIWVLFENVSCLSNNLVLRFFGRYSLEIYVIHCVFTAGFRTIFPSIGIRGLYLSILLNFAISTITPIIFSVFCKKIGIHGLLFKPVTYLIELKQNKMND